MQVLTHFMSMLLVARLLVLGTDAHADTYNIEFCIEIATNFTDLGGDYWTSNANRKAHGIYLVVERVGGGSGPDEWFGNVREDGCAGMILDDSYSYQLYSESRAVVNGVDIEVYNATPNYYTWVFNSAGSAFHPENSDGTETLVIPATTGSAQLAVASRIMHSNNMGLSNNILVYNDTACCSGGGIMEASTFSKTVIAHETGHGIGFWRDEGWAPQYSANAPMNSCNGDGVPQSSQGQVVKEYQSAAAYEGFADTISAWIWNDTADSSCIYDRNYSSDFDLDGSSDNVAQQGQVDCEGIPKAGLPAYVSDNDWLEDLINAADPAGCTGDIASLGTQYDWLRYGWDMVEGQGVSINYFVDIYDAANPNSWDPDDNAILSLGSPLTSDDVIVRWETAAYNHPADFTAEHNASRINGQDH